jgi:hypothetical protein
MLSIIAFMCLTNISDSKVEGSIEAANNAFVTYHGGNLSQACAEEELKQSAELKFRYNTVPIWWQHIQRSGGYLMCSYARSNGVYDLGTKVGCPTCPCGHGSVDRYLDKICHKNLNPALIINHPQIKNPDHSKKDRSEAARPTVTNVNFIMVEYSTFKKCPPEPGKFVYVTLIRHPIDQLISWAVRFEGIKVNKAWQRTIRSYENGNKRELQKFLRKRRDSEVKKHGGYFPHRVHSITNTFGATSLNSDEERIEIAMRNLLKFNFVWLHDNFNEEVESTAAKYLNWKEGRSYIEKLGKGVGQYVKYKGKDTLPKGMLETLERYMAPDIAVYKRMAAFNRERAELRKLCELE